MSLQQFRPQFRFDEVHSTIHCAQPLFIGFGIRGGVQPELQITGPALLGAHGNRHQRQTFHFVRVVQRVLQRDAGSQGEPAEDQVVVEALGVKPTPEPVGVAFDAATRRTVEMSGQMRSQTPGVVGQLMDVGIGAAAGAGAMNEYHLRHRNLRAGPAGEAECGHSRRRCQHGQGKTGHVQLPAQPVARSGVILMTGLPSTGIRRYCGYLERSNAIARSVVSATSINSARPCTSKYQSWDQSSS